MEFPTHSPVASHHTPAHASLLPRKRVTSASLAAPGHKKLRELKTLGIARGSAAISLCLMFGTCCGCVLSACVAFFCQATAYFGAESGEWNDIWKTDKNTMVFCFFTVKMMYLKKLHEAFLLFLGKTGRKT